MAQDLITNSELRCGQRCQLFCCPCSYFNEPQLATTDCCLCCHEIKKEDRLQVPPLIEMSSTWTNSTTPIPIWFIILRNILTLAVIASTLISFLFFALDPDGGAEFFFIYLTQWTLLTSITSMVLKSVSTNIIYRLVSNTATYDTTNTTQQQELYTIEITPKLYKLYIVQNIFLQISLPGEIAIVVLYWGFLFDGYVGVPAEIIVHDLLVHLIAPILVYIDFILSAERFYYKAAIWPIFLGIVYTLWTIIFEILELKDENGNQRIYPVYDWSEGIVVPIIVFSVGEVGSLGIVALLAFVKNLIIIGAGTGELNEGESDRNGNDVEMGGFHGGNSTGIEI